MPAIHFPFERVVEINTFILNHEPGMQGTIDIGKLQGALARIDNAILYQGLDDVFEIAAKYAASIAQAHSMPDANKRTALSVCLEYLSLNDFELTRDNDMLADAMVDLVTNQLSENEFADALYSSWVATQP